MVGRAKETKKLMQLYQRKKRNLSLFTDEDAWERPI